MNRCAQARNRVSAVWLEQGAQDQFPDPAQSIHCVDCHNSAPWRYVYILRALQRKCNADVTISKIIEISFEIADLGKCRYGPLKQSLLAS